MAVAKRLLASTFIMVSFILIVGFYSFEKAYAVLTSSYNNTYSPSTLVVYSDRGEAIIDSNLADGTPCEGSPANFKIHICKIENNPTDFWIYATCIEAGRPACRSVSHSNPYRLVMNNTGGSKYNCTIPQAYWGNCVYERGGPRAQNTWYSGLLSDTSHWQTCQISAYYSSPDQYPDAEKEDLYGSSTYLTNAKQTNPNQTILPNDPLTNDETSWIKSQNDRNGEYYAKTPPTGTTSLNHTNLITATWKK